MNRADRRRRRRVGGAALAVTAVLAVAAGTAASTGFGLPKSEPSPARSDLPPATAAVTRQTLVDRQSESGTLGHGDAATVSGRLSGTITGLPAPGATLRRGSAVYHLDDTPVVLLYGRLPAYRALGVGLEGNDVKQFEQNLHALGYRGFTVDTKYSAATARAVRQWQDDLGLSATGTVELGRVVYANGPIRVDSRKAAVGDAVQPGAPVLTYTTTARLISVELDISDQRLARRNAAVSVRLATGRTVTGRISTITTVVEPAQNDAPASTKLDLTIAVHDQAALTGMDQATAQVAFTASQRKNVLTVPIAALLALAGGGYGVQVVDGTITRIVPVETGLFADGRVEVSAPGLAEGQNVGMPT